MNEKISKLLKLLDRGWWSPILVYLMLFGGAYLTLWAIIEPADVPSTLALPSLFSRRIIVHLIVSAICASHLTVALVLLFRLKKRETATSSPGEMHRVHEALKPFVDAVSRLAIPRREQSKVRGVVQAAASALASVHFGSDRLPEMKLPDMPAFDDTARVDCRLCGLTDAGITRTGQCSRCHLFAAQWLGVHNVQRRAGAPNPAARPDG